MFALQLHTSSTAISAKAESLWCAQATLGGMRQDSSYLVKPTSITFASNPEVGT